MNVGEGGWDRLHKQVALLLQVCCAESSWEGFLTRSEEPESTFFLFHSTLSVLLMKKKGGTFSNRRVTFEINSRVGVRDC